jgi:hypothetical protein
MHRYQGLQGVIIQMTPQHMGELGIHPLSEAAMPLMIVFPRAVPFQIPS